MKRSDGMAGALARFAVIWHLFSRRVAKPQAAQKLTGLSGNAEGNALVNQAAEGGL
jgi:hypothetical protein